MAVRGAHPKPPWRSCPDAVMMHEAFDAATAYSSAAAIRFPLITGIPPGAQHRSGNPQLPGNLAQRPSAARQQSY
jgi:hypothetical protein